MRDGGVRDGDVRDGDVRDSGVRGGGSVREGENRREGGGMEGERLLTLRLRHPEKDAVLELRLPPDTRFGALTALLYENGFVLPQKPGYGYLISSHLCGESHRLRDYLPEGTDSLDIQVFGIPQIMV